MSKLKCRKAFNFISITKLILNFNIYSFDLKPSVINNNIIIFKLSKFDDSFFLK